MSLPQGVLWQLIRQRALDAIPAGTTLDYRNPLTLGTWQTSGTYTISSTSSSKFSITTTPTDFGGVLLSDAAHYLDHALEHQASLMLTLSGGHWNSPAWQVVTFYYWCYFVAMALSRMLGHTVWYVTPEVARQFTILAPTGSTKLTQGTYEVICGPAVSAGFREINLSKRPRHVHDQLWMTVFGIVRDIYKEVGPGVAPADEERLYLAIIESARVLGDDWPSALRNAVNYRPGFAYTAPRFRSCIDTFKYLSSQPQTIDGLIDRLETNAMALRSQGGVAAEPRTVARMLADLTLLLSRLTHLLHEEIVDRSGVDRRWLESKQRFAKQQEIITDGVPWPC